MKCWRSHRLWQHAFAAWRELTGERKIKEDDDRVIVFGDRSGTWLDEAEQSEFAGLQEPFAVMHKAVLFCLHMQRNRDAANANKVGYARRTPAQLYRMVQSSVQRVVNLRWGLACSANRTDGGKALQRFRKIWEAPGFVAIPPGDGAPTVIMFMRAEVRARWRSQCPDPKFRQQAYAPPA